jgi:hypothetical protein
MTLLELAGEITTGVQRIAQREQIVRRIIELKRVDAKLDELKPVLDEVVSLVVAAQGGGLTISVDGLNSLRSRLNNAALYNGNSAVDVPALEDLVTDVRTEAALAKGAVTALWQELVDRRIPQRQGLRLLADAYLQLDPRNALAMELRQAVEDADQLVRKPPSSEALLRLDQLGQQIPQLSRDLVGDILTVRSFIERAARGGASLETLTPEVEHWIGMKGFERFFKITIGEPEA